MYSIMIFWGVASSMKYSRFRERFRVPVMGSRLSVQWRSRVPKGVPYPGCPVQCGFNKTWKNLVETISSIINSIILIYLNCFIAWACCLTVTCLREREREREIERTLTLALMSVGSRFVMSGIPSAISVSFVVFPVQNVPPFSPIFFAPLTDGRPSVYL